jgi:hypothetical protein
MLRVNSETCGEDKNRRARSYSVKSKTVLENKSEQIDILGMKKC